MSSYCLYFIFEAFNWDCASYLRSHSTHYFDQATPRIWNPFVTVDPCQGVSRVLQITWAIYLFAHSHAYVFFLVGKMALTFSKKDLKEELEVLRKEKNETASGSVLASYSHCQHWLPLSHNPFLWSLSPRLRSHFQGASSAQEAVERFWWGRPDHLAARVLLGSKATCFHFGTLNFESTFLSMLILINCWSGWGFWILGN